LANPNFIDKAAARTFASDCRKIVSEIDSLPAISSDLATVRTRAALAAEFLTGDVYLLSTSKIKSVVRLRDWVKIPPPSGYIYVKKYKTTSDMPPEVADAFQILTGSEDANVRGVTMCGRYIALIEGEYHDELEDNLAHEMVHAYITVASPKPLPLWFQEGTAVYFSTGQDSRLYGNTGDPKVVIATLPEDYKTRLHSLQYIENKVGRKKLYDFVRESVETGNVDPRKALGLAPAEAPKAEKKASSSVVIFIMVGAIILGVVIWFIIRRDEAA
jgi:hypothetical protein